MSEDTRGEELHDDTGPVVVQGEYRYSSVSQIKKFDETVAGGCERRWWFEKVLGLPGKEIRANVIGKRVHAEIEHTIKTGERTLSLIPLAGARFIPAPDKRLLVEQCVGDGETIRSFDAAKASTPGLGIGAHVKDSKGRTALHALGVPFVGFIDLVNPTGQWIDTHGDIEPLPDHEVEILDWKTSKNPERWAKTPHELRHDPQMIGYARWATLHFPKVQTVRLSHVYFATEGAPRAFKVFTVMSKDDIKTEWVRIESVVREMKRVARISNVHDVKPNWNSCSAYGGCPHRNLCGDRSTGDAIRDLIGIRKSKDGAPMSSMLDKLKKKAPATPAQPEPETKAGSTQLVPHQANVLAAQAIEVERARLLAAEKGVVLPPDAPASGSQAPVAEALPKDVSVPQVIADAAAKVNTGEVGKGKKGKDKKAEAPKVDQAVVKATIDAGGSISDALLGNGIGVAGPSPASAGVQGSCPTPPDVTAPPFPASAPPSQGFPLILMVDVVCRGVATADLRAYLEDKCAVLCKQFGAVDVRCAPADSPLGFGKWKGALAGLIREEPPPSFPMPYQINFVSEDERAQVLVATLEGLGFASVRGAR